jgi:hypothetical protein
VPVVKDTWSILSEDVLVIDPVALAMEVEKEERDKRSDSGVFKKEVGDSHGVSDENPPQGGKRRAPSAMVERLVFARAKFRCETPGCTERRFLAVAHITAHSKGGPLTEQNLCLACFRCNQAEQKGLIRLEGTYGKLKVSDRLGHELTAEGIRRAVGHLAEARAG